MYSASEKIGVHTGEHLMLERRGGQPCSQVWLWIVRPVSAGVTSSLMINAALWRFASERAETEAGVICEVVAPVEL